MNLQDYHEPSLAGGARGTEQQRKGHMHVPKATAHVSRHVPRHACIMRQPAYWPRQTGQLVPCMYVAPSLDADSIPHHPSAATLY